MSEVMFQFPVTIANGNIAVYV